MHNGWVTVNGEKMSKSLGNFFTVRDLLAEFPGEAIRLALLQAHYRQPLDFTEEGIRQAKQTLDRWQRARGEAAPGETPSAVLAALEDDLNTPLAVAEMHALADAALRGVAGAAAALAAAGDALGLLQVPAETWFRGGDDDVAEIEGLIAARAAARKGRDFKEADRIRAKLTARGVVLEDTAQGTTWRRAG
jgi:cysteinyl-tRNA synthetase